MMRTRLAVVGALALGLAACRTTVPSAPAQTLDVPTVEAPFGECTTRAVAPDVAPIGDSVLLAAAPGLVWSADTDAAEAPVDTATTGRERQSGDPYSRPGAYLGFSFGRAFENFGDSDTHIWDLDFDFDSPPDAWDSDYYDPDDSSAIAIRGGFRFDEALAGELEFASMDGFDDSKGVRGGKAEFDLELWTLTASVKGYFSAERFQLYLVGGAGVIDGEEEISVDVGGRRITVSEEETSAVFRLGVGADVYASESWAANLEFSFYWPTGDLSDYSYGLLTIGALYRF